MKTLQRVLAAGLLTAGALAVTTGVAQARGGVAWSVGLGFPGVAVGVGGAPYPYYAPYYPAYYAPYPYYAAPVYYGAPAYYGGWGYYGGYYGGYYRGGYRGGYGYRGAVNYRGGGYRGGAGHFRR